MEGWELFQILQLNLTLPSKPLPVDQTAARLILNDSPRIILLLQEPKMLLPAM